MFGLWWISADTELIIAILCVWKGVCGGRPFFVGITAVYDECLLVFTGCQTL